MGRFEPGKSHGQQQWNPETANRANRWMLRHVMLAPGGMLRFFGFILAGFTVLFGALAVDPNPAPDDEGFWVFITIFFGAASVLCLVGYLIARRRSRTPRQGHGGPDQR
jgi:hypothetical protein